MRNLKKFLALVMAMVMAFSLMVTVNAAHAGTQYTDEDDVTPAFEEAMEVLTGMGVYQGDEEAPTFRPASTITRAEVAALIYRLSTGDVTDARKDLYKDYGNFVDVTSSDWFAGYVGYCANAGYIKGHGGYFSPYDSVTGYEVLAMVLRAVGYDKNHEFEGAAWETNVSALSTQLGVLKQVKSTHYGDRLYEASRRDVVASLLFETAANVNMVNYSAMAGYNKYTNLVNTELNPTLGEKNFGLTCDTGIIVGNQATGEDYTKVDFEVTNTWDGGALTKVERTGSVGYIYNSVVDANATSKGNLTLSYNINTGLDLFGHKANVWFDSRTASGKENYNGLATFAFDTEFSKTYAAVDKATLDKTVFSSAKSDADLLTAKKAATTGLTSVYTAAKDAGFHKDSNPQWGSDRYSQMGELKSWTSNGDAATAVQSKVGMYRIISNNDDLKADVVISLNQEVAKIDQRNSTAKDGEYIFLDGGNSTFGSQLATGTAGQIFDDQLSPASVKTLGTVVTAHQIVGTNSDAKVHDAAAVSRAWVNTGVVAATTDVCWYETVKLEPSFTGTIATYKVGTNDIDTTWLSQNGVTGTAEHIVTEVTLSDGSTHKLSGITGSFYDYGFDATPHSHLINGVTPLTDYNTAAGVTFSFYEDAVGRFIGVKIPNDYEFLYTTFADYEIGTLGTGSIGYYAYGVNWDGEIVRSNNQIKTIRMPIDHATYASATKFDEAQTSTFQWPGVDDASKDRVLAEGYNWLPVTLKNQGNTTVGNQIQEGVNTRFMLSPNGDLDWYAANLNGHRYNKYGTRFTTWYDTTATAADDTWTITDTDAKNGFARVYNDKGQDATTVAAAGDNWDYLLTNDTKFIVVTGAGTSDLAVKTYTGLTDLLQGGTSAEIRSGVRVDNAGALLTNPYADNVYFLTSADQFGNTDVDKNRTITTVIMADTNLTQYNAQSLYFAAPGTEATGAKLAGNIPTKLGTVNQYELYNNGVKSFYWVSDTLSTGTTAGVRAAATLGNGANGAKNEGDFYRLTPVGEVNGQTIYKADNATQDSTSDTRDKNDVNVRYDYIVVNNLSTADINGQVFNVSGAVVAEAYGKNVKGSTGTGAGANIATFVETNTINSLETLHHAVSMGKAGASGNLYKVSVAIVNDGVNVSTIYVTDVNTTGA